MHRSSGTPARVTRTSAPSTLGRWLRLGLPQRRVQDGPEMDDPTKQEEPKHARQNELNHGDEQAPLEQLREAGTRKLQSAAMTFPADPCPAMWPPTERDGAVPGESAVPPHGLHVPDGNGRERFHNRALQRKSRTNVSGASVSGRAVGSSPRARMPSTTRSLGCRVAATSTLRSCLRRREKQAVTKTRNGASSAD